MNFKKSLTLLSIFSFGFMTLETVHASKADFITSYNYTIRYLPRFQTWASQLSAIKNGHVNELIGPSSPMNPDYKAVVAINVDTLYTSATLDLSVEPQILTLPPYAYSYSILQVDGFGNVLSTGLASNPAGGSYALCGPDFSGSLPANVTKITVPQNWSQIAIRTSLYTLNGTTYTDTQTQAANFRASTRLQSLSTWMTSQGSGGETQILGISGNFSIPTKSLVDGLIQTKPKDFLEALQAGMESPSTTPLSSSDKALIAEFRTRFANAKAAAAAGSIGALSDICEGARVAHDAIIANWRLNKIGNNWVHFNNLGEWGDNYLDRASGNLYIQYCNNKSAAYYAQAFLDNNNELLTGAGNKTYTITFAANQIPQCQRFWSVTAYTGDAIELVPNAAAKYAVASYTPGLVTSSNGSITITLKTIGSNETSVDANVLPIPDKPFSVMLRVYAPLGTALEGTYVPPAVISGNVTNAPTSTASQENPTDWLGSLREQVTSQITASPVAANSTERVIEHIKNSKAKAKKNASIVKKTLTKNYNKAKKIALKKKAA